MTNEKSLFIVSGPAGVGKDSVVQALRDAHTEIDRSVTATTRAPRPGEVHGINYYYMSVPEFEQLKAEDGVLESNFFCGNYYGTLRSDVEKRLADGKVVVLVIDVHGAANIKKLCPACTTIFICPPSEAELEKRLRGRATETEDKILERLAESRAELAWAASYDERVINDTIESCADQLYQIIQARRA